MESGSHFHCNLYSRRGRVDRSERAREIETERARAREREREREREIKRERESNSVSQVAQEEKEWGHGQRRLGCESGIESSGLARASRELGVA